MPMIWVTQPPFASQNKDRFSINTDHIVSLLEDANSRLTTIVMDNGNKFVTSEPVTELHDRINALSRKDE